jgi:hypothetical protein
LEGTPVVHLIIEPKGRRIGARFFSRDDLSLPSPLKEVSIRQIGVGEKTALEIMTGTELLFPEFYTLCCRIADRIQIEGEPVSRAVASTLASWSALIRKRHLLDDNRQIGLMGELLFLAKASAELGWNTTARCWFGPNSEEHDFVLPAVDAEVKTTTKERRIHDISSLTQLLPKQGRALYLVSVQLTACGDIRGALSLPKIVASTLAQAEKASSESADRIRAQLQRLGWHDEDAGHYGSNYSLRTPIEAAEVDNEFPAIVPATIARLSGKSMSRFETVAYSINVDGLGFSEKNSKFKRMFRTKGHR